MTAPRVSRPVFLAACLVGALVLPVELLIGDHHAVARAASVLRTLGFLGMGVGVLWHRVAQRPAEVTVFWLVVVDMAVLLVLGLDGEDPTGAGLVIALSAPVPLALATLLAPLAHRRAWLGSVLALILVPGGIVLAPADPAVFARVAVVVVLLALVLSVLDANARSAEDRSRMAFLDALTGLQNRRGVETQLGEMMHERSSIGTMLLADLDHFKDVNDEHGHAEGDRTLVAVADVVREIVPADAVCGRWGGEEFLVVLPGVDHVRAMDLAELIRDAVGRKTFVTVSIGVTPHDPMDTLLGWVRRADVALYEAKAAGRDRVVGTVPPQPPTDVLTGG